MNQNQSKKTKTRIVLTGGHGATTALSVVEELIRRKDKRKPWDIYWIGAKRAFEGKSVPSLGSYVLPKLGVTFEPIVTGRIQTRFTLWTMPSLIKIPIGFISAFIILLRIKPKAILSFGGYAAFPVVVSGKLLGIPVVIHEQTAAVGRANKISTPFADKIALARESSLKYFPKEKSEVVGNPVPSSISEITAKKKPGSPPVIYITGGSRGSVAVNTLFGEIIEDLLQNYIVIHQTGYVDFEKFKEIKSKLSRKTRDRYQVHSLIDPTKIDGIFRRADIVVARAGANTVSDIMAAKRPAIFIPLPHAYLDEQRKNAIFAKKFGVAEVLNQEFLSAKDLLKEINKVYRNWNQIVGKIKDKRSPDLDAAGRLTDLLLKTINK